MPQEIEGIFKNGRVELSAPPDVPEETRVLVTFPDSGDIELAAAGIDHKQAADLRGRLGHIAQDWDAPEMSAYDNYDSSKT